MITDLTNTVWKFDRYTIPTGYMWYNSAPSLRTFLIDISIPNDAHSYHSIIFWSYQSATSNLYTKKLIITTTSGASGHFTGFYSNTEQVVLSEITEVYRDYSRTFTITGGTDATNETLIAWLVANATQINTYTVTTAVSPQSSGTVTGAGTYVHGQPYTVTATPNLAYSFSHWTDTRTGIFYSRNNPLTETPTSEQSIYLTANFSLTDPYDIDIENLPSDTVTDTKPTSWMQYGDTGLYEIYIPTEEQMKKICRWLFSSDFIVAIGHLIANLTDTPKFQDFIISMSVVPFEVTSIESTTKQLKIGWFQPTTAYIQEQGGVIDSNWTKNNYFTVDCGSITVDRVYQGALDFQTDIQIYLPFIGYQQLETYDVMGKTINPIYQVDLLTGECVCKILVNGNIKYQFTGSCGYTLPITSVDYSGIFSKVLNGTITTLGAMGKLPSMVTGSTKIDKTTTTTPNIHYAHRKDLLKSITGKTTHHTEGGSTTYQPMYTNKDAIGLFTNMGSGVVRSGSLRSNAGFLGVNKPYLLIVRPNLDMPSNFGKYNGFPCNKYLNLGELTGFTIVDEVILTGFTCTNEELAEVEEMLKEGIIL